MARPSVPSKLTPETQQRIAAAIQVGATYELAAQYGGIHYDTFNRWMKRGAAEAKRRESGRIKEGTARWQKEEPFFGFYEAIKEAEGKAVVGWLAKIEKAANEGSWQAAAWKLERRYPKDYGRSIQQVEHTWQTQLPEGYEADEVQRQFAELIAQAALKAKNGTNSD